MRNLDIKLDYLSDTVSSEKIFIEGLMFEKGLDIFKLKYEFVRLVNDLFPNSTSEDKFKILQLLIKSYMRESAEKIQMVWSGPDVSGLPGRDTEILLEELILEAKYSVLISIYSLSDYASKIIGLLKKKAVQGVYVEIFVNNFDSKRTILDEIFDEEYKRLSIYDYIGAQNVTQALHAKVVTIDGKKSLITSSNLSYNGLDGNLELGVLVHSKERAKEIRAIFHSMYQKRYFKKVK